MALGLRLLPVERPAALVPLALGAVSIVSLLLYFYGAADLGTATRWLLLPAVAALVVFVLWAWRSGDRKLVDRILAGLWAGALATLAYDLVRVPIAASGTPVFKAISYFGTLMLGETRPTTASEIAGWSYHLSNGIGFGLMYAVLFVRPRLWTAVTWGVFLEAAMLVTPYVEVFGYRLSPKFLAITVGAHVVFGAVLWAALRYWERSAEVDGEGDRRQRRWKLAGLALLAPVGVGLVAADFNARHVATIPASPPPYIGAHLYTTWNVLEPDRIAVLWLTRRYVDPQARFHFVEPFTHIPFGQAIDTPEADIRRGGTRSATEILIEERGLGDDERLALLAEMAHLFEIARWRLPSRPEAYRLGELLMEAAGECRPERVLPCVDRGFDFLDAWYAEGR